MCCYLNGTMHHHILHLQSHVENAHRSCSFPPGWALSAAADACMQSHLPTRCAETHITADFESQQQHHCLHQ